MVFHSMTISKLSLTNPPYWQTLWIFLISHHQKYSNEHPQQNIYASASLGYITSKIARLKGYDHFRFQSIKTALQVQKQRHPRSNDYTQHSDLGFPITILQLKEPRLFAEIVDSRARAGKVQVAWYILLPDGKEVLKKKKERDGNMSKRLRANPKELPIIKAGAI